MRSACGDYDTGAGRRKGNSNSINGSEAHGGQDVPVPHMRMKHITRSQRQSNQGKRTSCISCEGGCDTFDTRNSMIDDSPLVSKEEEEVASAGISSYSYMQRRKDEEKRLAERLDTHREYSYMKATNYSKKCEMCFENEPTWRCLDCRRGGLDLCSICMGKVNCNLRHRFECISTKTGGFVRAVPKQETLKTLTCACCGSRDAGQSDGVMSEEVGEKKILSTLLEGDKYITVISWKCGVCEMPVGLNAVAKMKWLLRGSRRCHWTRRPGLYTSSTGLFGVLKSSSHKPGSSTRFAVGAKKPRRRFSRQLRAFEILGDLQITAAARCCLGLPKRTWSCAKKQAALRRRRKVVRRRCGNGSS